MKIGLAVVAVIVVAGLGVAAQRGLFSASQSGPQSVASSTAPSLTESVKYDPKISPEVKTILVEKIADLRSSLAKNYDEYQNWLVLAIRYKTAGDYDKARKVWEYLSFLHPDDAVSRHNLGDLYHNFIKDYPKAESYYLQAIDAAPTQSINYLALSELYRYLYKQNTSAAADILKLGIQRVPSPQNTDLKNALAALGK